MNQGSIKPHRAVIAAILGCLLLGTVPAFAQDTSGYINVRDFIVKAGNPADHTEAIRAAFAEAAKTLKYAVLFPPGYYNVSDTINIANGGEIVGRGYPTIQQGDPQKDIFYDENTWRKTIRGLSFRGGRDQIAIGNKNVDQGFLLISDCRFSDSEGVAIRFLGGPGYAAKTTASTYCIVEKCAFANCAQTLISVSDDAHFKDAWISTKPHSSNKAVIENYGNLSIDNVLGVPRVRGTDQRWIDNHGGLGIKKFRFGGEGAGFTPVVNFAKYQPQEYGGGIVIEQSYVSALGNNKRACAVYCEEIPNLLVIRDCTLSGVPSVLVDKKIDLKTYFDGARPGMFRFDVSGNTGEFAGELPDAMIQAAANRKIKAIDYGARQLTEAETQKALAAAVVKAKTIPPAPPGKFEGHQQQTEPAKYVDINPSKHKWDTGDYLDALTEKCSDYLAVAQAGDDVVILNRIEKGSWPHIHIRGIEVDLDKTPWLTWRIKDNSAEVKGGHFAVKVIDNATGGMATLIENYNPDQYQYYAYDLRKVFGTKSGKIKVDIKFFLCGSRDYGAMAKDVAYLKKGDYFIIDFIRLETEE